jgi:hypothetical protein
MDLMTKLEKRFGSWAIPHLTLYLIGAQAIGVMLLTGGYVNIDDMVLVGGLVELGQWTRLFSFMMIPKTLSVIWLFFAFYIFYLMGSTLEREWGAFRYNLFILTGYLFTIAAAFIARAAIISNFYFLGGVFLAFSTLMPNFELRLFFIFPVKVKWFGWFTVGIYLLTLIGGDTGSQLSVLATFSTYALFFGKGFITNVKAVRRRQVYIGQRAEADAQPMHTCAECGASDKNDRTLSFRYCSTCGKCFCDRHISEHEH